MSAIQRIQKTADSLDELADLIANPPANAPVRAAIGNAGRRFCNAFGNAQFPSAPQAQLPGVGLARATASLVCKPYFDQQGFDGPAVDRPFEGGQCPAPYTVQVFVGNDGIFVGGQSPKTLTGPLGGVTRTIGSPSGGQFPTFPVTWTFSENPTVNALTVTLNQAQIDLSTIRVTPQEGNDDDCGDPPGEFGPGANPPPDPGPFPAGDEPGFGPDGQPFFFIPDIDVPGFEPVPVDDNPLGGGDDGPGGSGSDAGRPGDEDAIGDEEAEVNGNEDGQDVDFGEPPEGRIWVGCIVQTTTDTVVGNIPGTGPQSTVWPSVRANLALKYGSRYSKSERVQSRFHEIFRPNNVLTVTGCFIKVQPGSTCKVFPVSALKCPENQCTEDESNG